MSANQIFVGENNYAPIIAMTSHYNEPDYQAKCLRAEMNSFCRKPNVKQLKHWINFTVTNNPDTCSLIFVKNNKENPHGYKNNL